MKKFNLENKKNIIILSVIIITIVVIFGLIYIFSNNNKNIETSQSIDISNSDKGNVEDLAEKTEIIVDEIEGNNEDETEENIEIEEIDMSKLPEITTKEQEEANKKQDTNININNTNKYYIKINISANVVTIYTKDIDGNYTVPAKAMVCSTGKATPQSGKYKMPGGRNRWGTLFGHNPGTYVYGQYTTKIVGHILFHSVPYTEKGNPASLEYWEYDKLGTNASAGCIRLSVIDAKWIFNNIPGGTIVEFYSDSNPGPLGKPFAQKISGNVACRNWDPTDPDKSSPWRNGSVGQTNKSNEELRKIAEEEAIQKAEKEKEEAQLQKEKEAKEKEEIRLQEEKEAKEEEEARLQEEKEAKEKEEARLQEEKEKQEEKNKNLTTNNNSHNNNTSNNTGTINTKK